MTKKKAAGKQHFAGRLRALPYGVALAAVLALAACDSDPLAIFEEDPPAPETAEQADARARSDAAVAADADAKAPDLRSVPERPAVSSTPSTREKVIEGLVADRANARYTDEAIRLQGTGRTPSRTAPSATPTPSETATKAARIAQVSPDPVPAAPPPAPAVPAAASSTAAVSAPPPAPSPVPPQAAKAAPSVASSTSAPARTAGAAASTNGAVTVDTSALDAYGPPLGDPLTGATGGEQVATIQFAHSSSRLDDRDRAILQQVAAIQRQSGGNLVVVGHASSRTQQLDKVEHEIANLDISMARANAVADALVASGVQRERVVVEAVSDSEPMFAESMPTGEAGNRRAEIYLVR
jgi:outer membrane protein OmpA-like peptidoglycan-associated protein